MGLERNLPNDQYEAAINANAPTAANPFATIADASGGGAPTIVIPSRDANTNATTYEVVGQFIFAGSAVTGTVTKINSLLRRNGAATSVSLRVYDVTNAQVIAEITGVTNLNADLITDIGAISNVPVGEAKFEIQVLRVGGPAGARAIFSGLEIRL
jgi:predicted deacylase